MRKLILTTILGMILGSISAQQSPENVQGPHLNMEVASFDFGAVARKGGDLNHDFSLINDGNEPLVITRVVTSCSCLKASFSKRPIAPGQQSVIRITYEPHKKETGTFNKVIQIYSNSKDGLDVITVSGSSFDGDPTAKQRGRGKKKLLLF